VVSAVIILARLENPVKLERPDIATLFSVASSAFALSSGTGGFGGPDACFYVSFLIHKSIMSGRLEPIALVFWRSSSGREPVREWLNELSREDKRSIKRDIAKVQYSWPIGLPYAVP